MKQHCCTFSRRLRWLRICNLLSVIISFAILSKYYHIKLSEIASFKNIPPILFKFSTDTQYGVPNLWTNQGNIAPRRTAFIVASDFGLDWHDVVRDLR